MLSQPDEIRKALTDPRRVVEACGYSAEIVTEGKGIKIRCPWHADEGRPNFQVSVRSDGTIGIWCFVCQKGGDVFHLIKALKGCDFKEAKKIAQGIAGNSPVVAAVSSRDTYPNIEEVERFWKQSSPLTQDHELCKQLQARGIPPEMIIDLARAVPEVGWRPRWAWCKAPWFDGGYRLVVPMYSDDAQLVSVHVRRFGIPNDNQKGASPTGHKIKGSMMLSPAAQREAAWKDTIIVEGAPNYLVLAALYPERPVVGIISGSIKGCTFPRIPAGSRVWVWTDNELQKNPQGELVPGAGSKYAQAIAEQLQGRRLKFVRVPIVGGKKAPDANDIFRDGGADAIEKALRGDSSDPWESAAGLHGSALFTPLLDDLDLVRLHNDKPICRIYDEHGEVAPDGWMADALGLHFLQTGEVGPAGVLLTQGMDNFLVLAQHFDRGDPNAPALLAGPPVQAVRVTFWPPQEADFDHYVVRASEPHIAAAVGKHAVQKSLDGAQFVPMERPVPPPDDKNKVEFPYTDLGNAERLNYYYGKDLKFVFDWKEFMVWSGRHWVRDRTFEAQRRATVVTRMIENREWAVKSEGSDKHHSMVSLLREQPGIPILPERLDADPYLLNVRNGTLDLRTGQLLPFDRRHLMTKIADVNFDPKAKCPRWLDFLDRIFASKQKLIDYVQRAAGYSLTGDNSEEKMFMLYGKGRNGKSTFMLTLHAMLANYSQPMSSDLLMAQGDRNKLDAGQLSSIAALRGARFVSASETDEGARVSEKTVKQLVKRDAISAKFMGKDMFDFLPTHKLWLCTNHRLRITGKELGLWSALISIPFDVTIPDADIDRTLPAQLMAQKSGILNWLLAGCLQWQAMGNLGQPPEIDDAIRAYRKDMDIIQPFLDACCVVGSQYKITSQALRGGYELWCKETVKEPVSVRTFARLLEDKFPAARDADARFRQGLQLNETWQGLLEGRERQRSWGDRD